MKTRITPLPLLTPATYVAAFTSFVRAPSRKKRVTLSLFSVALLLAGIPMAVRGQSAFESFDPNANGQIRVAVVQPDGKILIGGDFTTLLGGLATRNHIARLNTDGSLDRAFDPNANGTVLSMAVQADGKILVGGFFGSIGGLPRNFIARLDPTTGAADPSFDPNPEDFVSSIAVQTNGQILVGGFFTNFTPNRMGSAVTRNHLARLNATGATAGMPDTFDPNPNAFVTSIVVQKDAQILVGGFFTTLAPNAGQPVMRNYIARLLPNGALELPFDPNPDSVVRSIAVQADGKILIGGIFNMLAPNQGQPVTRHKIARLQRDGTLDPSFDPNADGDVASIAIQPDGKILAVGDFATLSPNTGPQVTRKRIARLNPSGTLDLSFQRIDANAFVYGVAVQADGKIVVVGDFTTFVGLDTRNHIARLETDGTLEKLDFAGSASDVAALAVQPDGKILMGGTLSLPDGAGTHMHIARLKINGRLDFTFTPNANDTVNSIALQPDGKMLAGGAFTTLAPNGGPAVTYNHIARIMTDGTLDLPFKPNANNSVNAIALQPDGKIVAGGNFTALAPNMGLPVTLRHIARLEADGTLDTPFDPNADGEVNSIAIQADGNILAGGAFAALAPNMGLPVTRRRIARLKTDGTLDMPFDPNAGGGIFETIINSIAVQPDGKILAGGDFHTFAPNTGLPVTRPFIARLNPDGTVHTPFNPNVDGPILSIAAQANGKILVAGHFAYLGPLGVFFRWGIARFNPDGTVDTPFDASSDNFVDSIAIQTDGKILVGGRFSYIGGRPFRFGFARLSNDTAALQKLTANQYFGLWNVTWARSGSSPQLARVTFELSNNNMDYSPLGEGTASGSNWFLAGRGLRFPLDENFYIRARGYYRSGKWNGSESITESVLNAFIPPIERITAGAVNLSTRFLIPTCCAEAGSGVGPVGPTGANVGIGGFIITGSAPKHVLIRAIGPSLSGLGVPSALADPVLELHGPDTFATITNDNWRDDAEREAQILATGLQPTDDRESAIDATLDPGAYTAVISGQNGAGGVALVEIYDIDEEPVSKLANISTRAFVGTGDNIVIAGVSLGNGKGDDWIVVRGIGPSLTAFGVTNALADPTLELRDNNGVLLISNNDWQDNTEQAKELTVLGLAPTNNLESGIVGRMPPGLYTALLAGRSNGTGVGLVEVYDLGAQ